MCLLPLKVPETMNREIDPFQLEVIRRSFDAIAEDMSLTLMRTAHSGIVRDSLDFSTSICDAQGQPLAQGICTPMQLGSFYDAMVRLTPIIPAGSFRATCSWPTIPTRQPGSICRICTLRCQSSKRAA
jgi:hypothetical protein